MPRTARIFLFALIFLVPLLPLFSFIFLSSVFAASPGDVVINEVAWMGTDASTADEWIEFYNNINSEIDLSGWILKATDGTPNMVLSGTIPAKGFYLLERTDDSTVSDLPFDQKYTGALGNDGEYLVLRDSAGTVIDEIDCSTSWFAGDNTSNATMERINPEASGSAKLNWNTNDGVTVNGKDANGNPLKGTPKAQNSVYGKPREEESDEELEITFSLPTSVTAGEGFDVPVTVRNADPSGVYYAKAVVGESTESAALRKGYTYNPTLGKWLAWNGAWDEMPTFTTDADGDASFTLKSKVADNASSGTYYFLVRILKVGAPTDKHDDSDAQTFPVNAAAVTSDTPTSSSDPEVSFSVESDDLKVNQSIDVKVNIKNAKARHDYYVKIRLGLSESDLNDGRTYNSSTDTWLADNASWTKFPVVYTDGDGGECLTFPAKVASGNPSGTYIIGVRIRDKETEDNYDSATQTISVGEEPPEAVVEESDVSDNTGSVLGTITELPATGGGIGVTNLFVTVLLVVGMALRVVASLSINRVLRCAIAYRNK